MDSGRELDLSIAKLIFDHEVRAESDDFIEVGLEGAHPLRFYSTDISAAWLVADRMGISMVPVANGEWFALVGTGSRWTGPAEFIQYLQSGNFIDAGAAVGASAPLTICIAALKAAEHRNKLSVLPTDLSATN